MKKSRLAVRESQRKWGTSLSSYCQIIVLGTIIGSYIISLYLLCFDNRIWENVIAIITFNIFDGVYLLDSVCRFASVYQDRSYYAMDINSKSCFRCSRLWPLFLDFLSLIPGETFIFIWTNGQLPQHVTSDKQTVLFILACLRHETLRVRLNLYEREIRAIMMSFLALVVILFHGIACAWYALSCYPVYTNMPPTCVNSFEVRRVTGHPFYQHVNASLPDAWGRYVAALHWSVMTIRNSGNYYIVPVTTIEFATSCVFMLAGFLFTSSIICMAIYVMGQLDLRRSVYFHEALGVTNFVSHLKMEGHVTQFLYECFNHMWLRGRAFTDDVMKKLIPKTLQIEVAMSIFQPMVEASEFLQTLRREALEALSLKVEFKHYFPNEFIIRPHTVGYAMFYIMEGNVEVISNEDFKPILAFSKGSLIGEVNLALATYREHGVKTSTACEVLKLSWSSLVSVLVLDTNARVRMHEIIKKRMTWQTIRKKKKILKLEKNKRTFQPNRTNFLSMLANRGDPSLNTDSTQSIDSPISSGGSIDSQGSYRTKAPLMIRQNLASPGLQSTQFMSLFTWLRLHKKEQYNRTTNPGFANMFAKMEKKFRNEASLRCYQVLSVVTIPFYYWKYCAISRETYTFMFWDFFVNLTIIFYTIIYPVNLVLVDESLSQPAFVAVDIVYIMDLFFRFFIFRDRSEMAPLASMTQHFFNEARTGSIWFDIVATFPLHNIAFVVRNKYDRTYLYLRLHMLCKFGKLVLRFRRWEHDVTMNTTVIRILKHGIYILVIIVYVACNFVQQRCEKEGYVDCMFEDNSTDRVDRARYNFGEGSIFEILLYWAVCVTFGIGFTDVIAQTRAETTIHTVALLMGFFFVVYCCSDFAATLASAIENKINHQDNRIWLHRYLDENLTELDVIARVDRYLDVQWLVLRGINADTATRSVGFLSVSHTMYSELMVHIMAECLYQTDLFELLDAELVRQFCLTAKLAVVPPNEVIIAKGDFVRRMYVIRRGAAEVVLGSTGRKIGTLSKGRSIGFGELLYGLRSKIEITSTTYLEVIVIDAASIDRILKTSKAFEEIWNGLKTNEEALQTYVDHFQIYEKRRYSNNQADYLNVSTEIFVYHRVLRRFKAHKDVFLKEWRRLGIFRWIRFLMCPCTFLPTSKMLRIWEGFRVLTIILMVFMLPLLEAFPYLKKDYGSYIYLTDGVTVLDMLFRLHVAYYDTKTNDLVTHPLRSATHYLSTAFLTDVIGGPLVYYAIDNLFKFYASPELDTSIYAFLLRLNRMILLYHIYGAYSFTDRDSAFSSGQNTRRMLKLLPLFFFHAHMMACVMSVVTCPTRPSSPHPRCRPGTWISSSKTLADPPNSTTHMSAERLDDFQIYVFAYYYTATTLVGCGFGDFLPASYTERRYTAVLFYVYIFALAYIIASVVGSKCHLDYKLLKYQQDMSYLLGYLAREKVGTYYTCTMIRYYDYQWLRTRGIEPHKLFYNLFPSLRREVALSVFEDVMRQTPGLKHASSSFLRAICVHLIPIYFQRENVIVRQGDLCDMIYFIYRGTIVSMHNSFRWDEIHEGGTVGNLDPNAVNPVYDTTATAITNVDLFAIKKKDFNRVVSVFPSASEVFTEIAADTARKIQSASARLDKARKTLQSHRPRIKERKRVNKLGNVRLPPKNDSDVKNGQISKADVKYVAALKLFSKNEVNQYCGGKRSCLPVVQGTAIGDEAFIEDPDVSAVEVSSSFTQFLLPESLSIRVLETTVFLAASISVSLASYQAAFQDTHPALFTIGYVCDAIYLIKMGITFRLIYIDDFGDIISDYTEIENKYLSNPFGFAWDFFSTFPLEMVTPVAPIKIPQLQFLALLRLNRVLRLVHCYTFFRIKRTASGALLNLLRMKLVRLLSLTGLYLHLAACILQTYTVHMNCGKCLYNETNTTWMHTKRVETGEPQNHPYVFTLYFILSAFTTTAYGDVAPVTKFEMLYISVIAVSSKVWLGLALSDILSGFQNTTDITYHLAAQGVLKLYNDYGVSEELQNKAEKYFTHAWVQNKGVIIPDYLKRAPANMKMDISAEIYGNHFRQSYLFRELGESFIRHACIRIKHIYVLAGDYIIQEKEIDNAIYFVHRGFVTYGRTIMNEDGNTKEEEGLLSRFRYFGENQGIQGPQPHEYSYKADCNVDVLRISHTEILELFDMFPEHKETILRRLNLKKTAANIDPFYALRAQGQKSQEKNNEIEESIKTLPQENLLKYPKPHRSQRSKNSKHGQWSRTRPNKIL